MTVDGVSTPYKEKWKAGAKRLARTKYGDDEHELPKQQERIFELSDSVREASNRGDWFVPIELFVVLQMGA